MSLTTGSGPGAPWTRGWISTSFRFSKTASHLQAFANALPFAPLIPSAWQALLTDRLFLTFPVSAQRAQPLSYLTDTSYSLPPLLLPRILFLSLPSLPGQAVKGRMGRVVPGILLIHEAPLKAEKREHIVWCSFKVLPGLRVGQETKSIEAWLSSSTLQPESHPLETGCWSHSAHRH